MRRALAVGLVVSVALVAGAVALVSEWDRGAAEWWQDVTGGWS